MTYRRMKNTEKAKSPAKRSMPTIGVKIIPTNRHTMMSPVVMFSTIPHDVDNSKLAPKPPQNAPKMPQNHPTRPVRIAWNKGRPHSAETRAKIAAHHKASGHKPPTHRRHTPEARAKISAALLGNTYSKGKKWSAEARLAITKIKAHQEGGKWRNSVEYHEWRTAVFTRDNYTCQDCGVRGTKLHADHIKKWAEYPELRFDLSNGRTLCEPCHKKTPNFGNRYQRKHDLLETTGKYTTRATCAPNYQLH